MSRKFPDYLHQELVGCLLRNTYQEDACFVWDKGSTTSGYGVVWFNRTQGYYTHRVAFNCWVHKLKSGEQVNHICHNPACFNPKHLYAGSHLDNMKDKRKKFFQSLGLTVEAYLRIRNNTGYGLLKRFEKEYNLKRCTIDKIRAGFYDDVA